ncbi:TetR/AcrR family transcriptional regulator [Demequina sp. NBRC 110054]|uniref:TetR/AcrR family transcriptional regulator n=1 Tax=Demequina sp. NBRC 110054 TaxID=1570343 RepID=UPI001177FD31|nr:TetR/AcrR family transcriptional regulator [Demequina sp. NBRC 110054]
MQDLIESTPKACEGLRERKLRLARNATQKAAIELCLEHGLDAVTVEMIAERAGISARTFYNYFGTRESALLGDAKPVPTESHIARFVARDDVSDVEAFALMMADVWVEDEPDRELFALRHRLYEAEPTLAAANLARIGESRERLAEIAVLRLRAHRPEIDEEQLALESTLVVALAMGALQAIGRTWLSSGAEVSQLKALIHGLVPSIRRLTQTTRP